VNLLNIEPVKHEERNDRLLPQCKFAEHKHPFRFSDG
jgi:hypothetical protein